MAQKYLRSALAFLLIFNIPISNSFVLASSTGIISSSSSSNTNVSNSSSSSPSNNSSSDNTSSSNPSTTGTSSPIKTASVQASAMSSQASASGAAIAGVAQNVQSASIQVEASSGSANLSIPIVVAPGRGGIQPNLALGYSSNQRQLGNAGVGWNLDLGSIRISTKKGVPSYKTDIFIYESGGSSQDLVADPNVSGLYHLETEGSFSIIQFTGSTWIVTDKKGIKYYYGTTFASRISDPANAQHIFSWNLDRVQDMNGNTMTIAYLQDGNQIYPQTISYTGNSQPSLLLSPLAVVNISYTAAAVPSLSLMAQFPITTAKRIDQISIFLGSNVQSSYVFKYQQSAISHRDLLQSVQQVGADGVSVLPAVTFSYNNTPVNYSLTPSLNRVC